MTKSGQGVVGVKTISQYITKTKICNIINFLSHVMSPPVSDPVDSDRLNDQFTWALHPSPDVATDGLDPWKFAFRRNY